MKTKKQSIAKSICSGLFALILALVLVGVLTPTKTYAICDPVKLTPKELIVIDSIDIHIEKPIAGEKADYNPVLWADSHCHFARNDELSKLPYNNALDYDTNGVCWKVNREKIPRRVETILENPGKEYQFSAILVPDDGYIFADDLICRINNGVSLVDRELSATRGDGTSFYVSSVWIPVRLKSLPAPEFVSVKLTAYNAVKVTWAEVEGAQGYDVYYFDASGDEGYDDAERYVASSEGTSITLKKLPAGTKFYIMVRPFVEYDDETVTGSIAESNTLYTLKKLGAPKISKKSSGKVTVRWTNIPGESGYQISQSKSRTRTGTITTVKTRTGKSKVIKAPRRATRYYKVRAYVTVGGKKLYAPWSSVKKYKLK